MRFLLPAKKSLDQHRHANQDEDNWPGNIDCGKAA
jgi:hypothetical protein